MLYGVPSFVFRVRLSMPLYIGCQQVQGLLGRDKEGPAVIAQAQPNDPRVTTFASRGAAEKAGHKFSLGAWDVSILPSMLPR